MDSSMELWNMFSTEMNEGDDGDLLDEETNGDDFDPSCLLEQSLEPKQGEARAQRSSQRSSVNTPSSDKFRFDRMPDISLLNYDLGVGYICPACGLEYDTQETWKKHMNQLHNYNTRAGLNFVQLDKLYHECLECGKKIAMHSLENLLKHKFTHLPHRCTKCKLCERQYKYRQDLMVHLRIQHSEEILKMAKDSSNYVVPKPQTVKPLAIMEIQGGAHDIFGKPDDVAVRNEVLNPYDDDDDCEQPRPTPAKKLKLCSPAFMEDSRSSQSDSRQGADNDDGVESYVQYICPQCATECETYSQWRQHIEFVHDFGNRKGLCFQEINMGKQIQCLECNQVLYDTSLKNMQYHKFTHLAHPAWLVCKICCGNFADSQTIIQHLKQRHRLDGPFADIENDDSQDNQSYLRNDELYDNNDDDTLLSEQSQSRIEDKDVYDPHIDYICPQCGLEIFHRKDWRRHIIDEHQLHDIKVLNFSMISEKQLKCNECGKIITNAYGVQNAQQHRITHMPFKAITKCRKCHKAYTDRKGLVKHLRSVHFVGPKEEINSPVVGNGNSKPPNSNGSFKNSAPIPAAVKRPFLLQKPAPKSKRKQLVSHGNVVFEITYLDDDEDDDSNGGGGGFRRGGNFDDDNSNDFVNDSLPKATYVGNNNKDPSKRLKCSDCGSLFATQALLHRHIKLEHDFTDYHSLKNNQQKPTSSSSKYNDSTNDDSLLILPNGSEPEAKTKAPPPTTVKHFNLPNEAFERHISYICPSCGLELMTQVEWRRHINEVHNFDKRSYLNFKQIDSLHYKCGECNDLIANNAKLKSLQDHHIRHLPYKLYIKCLICFTRYNHKPNMISHLKVRHNVTDNRAKNDSISDLNVSSTSNSRNSSLHNSMVSNKPARVTGLNTIEDSISYHNAVDLDFITYFCPQCNENFDSHVFWRKHIVECHNLATREGLNFRQLDNHHYLCLECYKRVTVTHTKGAIGQLQSHKFRHLPYRSFKCLTCGNGFVRKQMFFKHLNRETNRCNMNQATESTSTSEATSPNHTPHSTPQHSDSKLNDDLDYSPSFGEAVQQSNFILVCPQCGERFDTQKPWREHINIVHGLNKRNTLNITKLGPNMHQCLECGEHINGNRLRSLQAHKFKHLPHGPYLQCKHCPQAFNHIRQMQEHLLTQHNDLVVKEEITQNYDEPSLIEEEDDENDNDIEPETVLGGTDSYNDETIMDFESDDQYLLG